LHQQGPETIRALLRCARFARESWNSRNAPADQLITAAKAEFSGGRVPPFSDEDAQRILSAIGAGGFCR
jgi:hypothetical protein